MNNWNENKRKYEGILKKDPIPPFVSSFSIGVAPKSSGARATPGLHMCHPSFRQILKGKLHWLGFKIQYQTHLSDDSSQSHIAY